MSDKPEKIWSNGKVNAYGSGKFYKTKCEQTVEYIRADLAKPSEDSKIVLDIRLAHKCYTRGQDPYHDLGRLMERITNILKQHPSPPTRETP